MLTISNVKLKIGDSQILRGVNFSVQQGESVGIIGPNGSGKTTLFNCISGFHHLTDGKILYNSIDISRIPTHKRAVHGLARVFQNFGIFREMTALENMLTALERNSSGLFFPWSKKHRANVEKAMGYLSEVNLADKAADKAGSLSGGQMRLLEIVRAMAFGAETFLLDEPTAGVSPKMKGQVLDLLIKLKNNDKTLLIIEHDMSFIQKLTDRIVVLNQGEVVLDDSPDEVRNNPLLKEIYFGTNEYNAAENNGNTATASS